MHCLLLLLLLLLLLHAHQSCCRNGNGTIEQEEFRQALGDVGANGDAAKDFVYSRVDRLSESSGHLNSSAFGNALVLMRAVLLGY
jgi:hypothetical protein